MAKHTKRSAAIKGSSPSEDLFAKPRSGHCRNGFVRDPDHQLQTAVWLSHRAASSQRPRIGQVAANPTAEWVARHVTEAFPRDGLPLYDPGPRSDPWRHRHTQIASPGHCTGLALAERIGSIRRECVDHIIVLGEVHLRRVLKSYASVVDKDAPIFRSIQQIGIIRSRPIPGGLHDHYVRV
jgi:hypothetical protein